MNTLDLDASTQSLLASLCDNHLKEEERLLRVAVPAARTVKEAFLQPHIEALTQSLRSHDEFSRMLDEIRERRRVLCAAIAQRISPRARSQVPISLTRIVALLPLALQDGLLSRLAFVRQLAEELVQLNHWLAVHSRIHLDAYEHMLRGLVGAAANSGRYGPQGKTESTEYRPLLEIHG